MDSEYNKGRTRLNPSTRATEWAQPTFMVARGVAGVIGAAGSRNAYEATPPNVAAIAMETSETAFFFIVLYVQSTTAEETAKQREWMPGSGRFGRNRSSDRPVALSAIRFDRDDTSVTDHSGDFVERECRSSITAPSGGCSSSAFADQAMLRATVVPVEPERRSSMSFRMAKSSSRNCAAAMKSSSLADLRIWASRREAFFSNWSTVM